MTKSGPKKNGKSDREEAKALVPMPTVEELPEDIKKELLALGDGDVLISAPSFESLGLGPKTVKALNLMTYEGVSSHLAAKQSGIRVDNFHRALLAPSVQRMRNQIVSHIKANGAMDAYLRMIQLAQETKSDNVKLEANKWLAGVGGIAALKRVEGRVQHIHSFGGFTFDDPDAIDVTPDDNQSDGSDD